VVRLNFQPVVGQGLKFQLAVAQAHNFWPDFQPAEKGKLKTWLKNMLWLKFRNYAPSRTQVRNYHAPTSNTQEYASLTNYAETFFSPELPRPNLNPSGLPSPPH
jgi:hypothetical protein